MTAYNNNSAKPKPGRRKWDLTHRIGVWASLSILLIASTSFAIHQFVELPAQKQREHELDRWLIDRVEAELERTARHLPHSASAQQLNVSLTRTTDDAFENHIREQLALIAPEPSFSGLFRIGSEHRLYHARINQTTVNTWFRPIDANVQSNIAEHSGLQIDWIPHSRYFTELNAQKLKTGQRSELGDFLYWALLDDNNTPALFMKIHLPARQFQVHGLDPQTLYPALLGLLLVLIGSWHLRRRITWPLRELEMQLQRLSRSEHYRSDLPISGAAPEIKRLAVSCSNLLEHIDDRTEELKTFSYTDALTGLGNRRAIDERRDTLWGMCRRQKVFMSALIFDLDYFKQYNDSYGHDGGDQVLVDFAGILRSHFARSGDVIARSGGEEFIALLFDTHSDAALLLANRVIKGLEQKAIVHRSSPISRYLTCSAGVASLIPGTEHGPEYLISMADKALYRAKAQGRNRAIAFKRASIVKFDQPNSNAETPD